MADVAVGVPALGKALKKPKASSKGLKKAKTPSTHPPVNEMIVAALKTLKERHGTSLQAVKKYIGANYNCDVAKLSPFIKKALKNGVANGNLVQTKGTGASGSFKLKVNPKLVSGEKAKAKARKSLAGGVKKASKKLTGAKKTKATPKRAAPAKKATTLKQKSTKHSKSVAKKPKAPKPKKAAGAKKLAAAKK